MVNLRFTDKEIYDSVGRTNAVQFLFWLDFDDYSYRDILFNFLENLKLESCVSPLHDKDLDLGRPKKPHYHVMIYWGSGKNKSVRQIMTVLQPIRTFISVAPWDKGDSSLEDCSYVWEQENKVQNMRGALRYFKHLDNPEKYQYFDDEFITFGGFDVESVIFSEKDLLVILKDLYAWVNENDCYNYADLVDYCRLHSSEWFYLVNTNKFSNAILNYQKSMCFRNTGAQDRQIDKYLCQDTKKD